MMLPLTQATAVRETVIGLSFPDKNTGSMARSICQERKAAIEKELAALAGRPITVSFDAPAAAKPADRAADSGAELFETDAAQSETAPAAIPAKATRLERSEVLNDPAVKMVLLGLNATPIHIEKVEIVPQAPEPDLHVPDVEPEETGEAEPTE